MSDISPEERASLENIGRLSPEPPRPPRRFRSAHAFVLVLVVLAGVVAWLVLSGGGEPAVPGAAPTAPRPGPTVTAPARTVFFTITDAEPCLRMREEPSTRSPVIDCLQPGVRLRSDGRTATREGRVWRHVYDHLRKRWAWAAGEFLTPA